MAETKRITVSLPNSLLEEVDIMVPMEFKNRSDLIVEAMKLFIEQRKKLDIIEKLKKGYIEMSQINLNFAEMGMAQDLIELTLYEASLNRQAML